MRQLFSPPPSAIAGLAILFLVGAAGCDNGETGSGVGQTCSRDSDCAASLRCFNRSGGEAACMAACEATTRLCEMGELCLETTSGGQNVCYLGGTNPIGTTCASSTECERGGVCVNLGGALSCYQACTTDDPDPPCAVGETCASTSTDSNFGFCRPDGM